MGWRGGVNGEVVLCTGELGPGCKQRAREGGRRVSHAEGRDARGERVRARGARVCAAHTPARRRVRAPLCVRVRARARPRARALHARARATRPRAFTRACVHTRVRSGVQVPAGVRMRGRSPPPSLPCLGPPRRQGALYSPPRERKCRAALLGSPAPCSRLFSPSAPPSLSRSRPAAPVPVLPRRRRSRHHEQEEEAVPGHACPPGLRAGAGPRVRRRPA